MSILFAIVLLVIVVWVFTRVYLRGQSLARYDTTPSSEAPLRREPSEEHFEVLELLSEFADKLGTSKSAKERLAALRVNMDAMGDKIHLPNVSIVPADIDGVPGEWVLAEGADSDRRLLYLHGGAFTMGSPRSHRIITSKLSSISGSAVLAVDYRLMPEHRRLDGLADCQMAYRWILENGPKGSTPLNTLFVAGDSAGGNLSLAVIAWARDCSLRAADGVVALSPATDGTLTSPSIISNLESDHMLGPAFRHLARLPNWIMLWIAWSTSRVRPCDPRVSPAHGDLSNLPPTLVHGSEDEMLLDDARRYVNKAKEAGSEASLETWHHMVHVWQAYDQLLPEASESFDSIAAFLEQCSPRRLEERQVKAS